MIVYGNLPGKANTTPDRPWMYWYNRVYAYEMVAWRWWYRDLHIDYKGAQKKAKRFI